ncbi:MAG TPA: ABC transporter permease, partial [Candidatus Dojkabacteria bacterium]|nr:ABC transporter permease [Candidatus Dojkabacteria bacterium]
MFKYALDLVLRRKMRTFLTSLGITIAVFLISFIIFGMQDLKGLLVAQFSTQFKPDQVIVSKSSVAGAFGGGVATYDKKAVETPVIDEKIVKDIASQSSVKVMQPYTIISGMQLLLPEKKVSMDNAIISAWDIKSSDSYFTSFTGNVESTGENEIFINKRVADYYRMTPEEMIGKKVEISPSKAALLTSRTQSMIGKKYIFTVVGVYVAGQKEDEGIVSTKSGIAMLSDLGGFKSSDDYLNKIGFDMLYVTVDQAKVSEFKSFIKDNYGYQTIASDDVIAILDSITQGLT